ncbi:MAG: hypothetical protein IT294_01855 [Deltaproteobacteria bacterium]|nr:hypothetical protein [Deltaproteobacteria bacterium]
MRSSAISCLDGLPCPRCGDALARGAGREGLVWICRACRGGAVTLPILRRFAPRPFVNGLWQTALHHGRSSSLHCPACRHHFTEVASVVRRHILACVRCYWVWLDCEALGALGAPTVGAALVLPRSAMPLPPSRPR